MESATQLRVPFAATAVSTLSEIVRYEISRPLAERARVVRDGVPRRDRGFVLYWMRTALRGHENPALDVALELAHLLDKPVFVYHALGERYPFASDRHHWFILEGAIDVARELEGRGIGHAFHLERAGHRGAFLRAMAEKAAVVVTEDMPVAPLAGWTEGLARRVEGPLLAVDTACTVPMALVPRAYDRAFAYRRATESLRAERVERPWPEVVPRHEPFVPSLPFEPVELESADLPALIGQCRIDHAVPPVPHTRGGTRAGMARWAAFRDRGLRWYARRRNDPLRKGVSGMSPYLHYGMVSPFLLAREAAARPSDGSRKFLDELLVWREVAYAFCFHRPDHATIEGGLPGWARQTLAEHEADPRPSLLSWRTLARAQTGDTFWDAMQTSLLRHGELHNNVRMTWGKALLGWTGNAAEALRLLEDLNHRYALDGRDPASYGGILWCLGQLDRPFPPARPILGTVRSRSTRSHARRLDVEKYRARVEAPAFESPPSVLVVGAGIAGLACAETLSDAGLAVRAVDKGRGPGGRLSTRRRDAHRFDHGAQFFTARDPRFRRQVESWRHDGLVSEWNGRILDIGPAGREPARSSRRYVGSPTMSRLGRGLSEGLDVRLGHRVTDLHRTESQGWTATCEDGSEISADVCVLTLPARQAVDLLPPDHAFRQPLDTVEMAPCIALMAAFDQALDVEFDGAFVSGSPLGWIARDSSKPGRPEGERWVLHASPEWSAEHLEQDPESLVEPLLEAFEELSGRTLPARAWQSVHRWRYARALRTLGVDHLFDSETGLLYAGDGCLGSRVEDAYLSGVAAAGALLRDLAAGRRQQEAR